MTDRLRVKMLKRHCALIPGFTYNLPQGKLLDFLLSRGIAVVLLPASVEVEPDPVGNKIPAKRKKKVVTPSELKS